MHVARDIVFIEVMTVDEKYRGMGVGHLFFEKAKEIRNEKNLMGSNYKLMKKIKPLMMKCIQNVDSPINL